MLENISLKNQQTQYLRRGDEMAGILNDCIEDIRYLNDLISSRN